MIVLQMILAALLLTVACAVDCFVAGLAYGTDKIKIPVKSGIVINLISSATLALSLFLGGFIGQYIPEHITLIIACSILGFIGLYKIVTSVVKHAYKNKEPKKEIRIPLFGLNFFIRACKNPEDFDKDQNKILSAKEAVVMALALSIDCLAVGLSAGLVFTGWKFYLIVMVISFIPDILLLYLGRFIGNKIAKISRVNLSWLSGLLLIGLAVMKIFI